VATTESMRRAAAPTDFPDTSAKSEWVAVLGRRDEPTDGIEDYCIFLGHALARHSVRLRSVRVPWVGKGIAALRSLWVESKTWRDSWVLLQYTTMGWSRRGFPFGAWLVLVLLRRRGFRCAVVFHEATRQTGDRLIDRGRGACQDWVIRRLYSGANAAIFLDPLDKIRWLPSDASKATFIAIGANIPEGRGEESDRRDENRNTKTVVVFCLSDPPNRHRELADIAHAMRIVAQRGVKARALFLGRGTDEAQEEIQRLFGSETGEAVNLGLQSADEVRRVLCNSDVMLCVRGPLYMRRGSAIAGIACGLPIVGYAGASEGTPLEQAGLALVPYLDRDALGDALARILADGHTLSDLRQRSIAAGQRCFSWDLIATNIAFALETAAQRAQL
jgi:glycosyltransferase involved in cell wall biosynthesis